MDEEVSTLLREWGLETYITVFEDNAITSMSLPLLGVTEIREMFPIIGHRVIFTRNFEAWRKLMHPNAGSGSIIDTQETGVGSSQNSSDISFALSDIMPEFQLGDTVQVIDSIEPSVTSSKNVSIEVIDDLKKILECSLEGKGILTLNKNSPLDHKARLKLVQIICMYVLRENPDRNITAQIYAKWANEIVDLFPAENRSVYFHNKIVESSRGIITRLAGKLPDSIHNLKRKYRQTGIIRKRKRSFSLSPISSREESPKSIPIKRLAEAFKTSENEELSDLNLEWLRNSSHPWETTEEKWEQTRSARFHRLKDMSIAQYYEEYPALKKVSGYKLLQKDFDNLYSENCQGLYEHFPSIKNDIFSLARTKLTAKNGYISELLLLEDSTEDTSNLGAFLLIPSLLTTQTIRLKGVHKKVWRPSKSEARDGFITIVHSDAEIEEAIAVRRDKLQQYGLTLQPYILLVEAVDICFKIIFMINAEYPAESKSTWMFIQKAFYKIDTKFDKESTAANTLLVDLQIKSKNNIKLR